VKHAPVPDDRFDSPSEQVVLLATTDRTHGFGDVDVCQF
jgi:hypothetical protein